MHKSKLAQLCPCNTMVRNMALAFQMCIQMMHSREFLLEEMSSYLYQTKQFVYAIFYVKKACHWKYSFLLTYLLSTATYHPDPSSVVLFLIVLKRTNIWSQVVLKSLGAKWSISTKGLWTFVNGQRYIHWMFWLLKLKVTQEHRELTS